MAAHRYWRINVTANNGYLPGAGDYVNVAELELRESLGGADATGSGTASASSTLGANVAANAFDNNTGNFWFSNTGAFPKWLKYDFGAGNDKDIVQVAYTCGTSEQRSAPTEWSLQWSDDNSSWTTLFTVQDSVHSSLGQKLYSASDYPTLGAAANEAWRLHITASNGGSAIQMSSLEFRDIAVNPSVASGGSIYAYTTNDSSLAPANLLDANSPNTMYASRNVSGEWVAYKWPSGQPKAITTIALRSPPGAVSGFATNTPKDFSLQYWDGSAWQTSWSISNVTGWTADQMRYFDATGEISAPTTSARPVVFAVL